MSGGSAVSVFTEVILPVIAVAAIGGIAGRRLGLQLETLQKATFFLFSPALVFTGLASIELDSGVLAKLALTSVVIFLINGLAGLSWSRLRGSDSPAAASIAVASAVPNQGNMGLPMAMLAFGAGGLEIATVLFVIGVVLNASAAVALGTYALKKGARREVLFAPLRFPAIYAAAAGIAVNTTGVHLPLAASESIATLARASIPVMLVILGMSFHVPKGGDYVDPLFVSANRLVIGPLVAWATLSIVGLDRQTQSVAIMMAGMPVAVNTTILARQLGADVSLSVRAVVVSTALSLLTLSVLVNAVA